MVLLQDDVPTTLRTEILNQAKSNGTKSILTYEKNIENRSESNADITLKRTDYHFEETSFNCYCGTLAACLQAGLAQEQAEHYAKTAANLTQKHGTGYKALPYIDEIENNL